MPSQEKNKNTRRHIGIILSISIIAILALIGLYELSQRNYLLFHSLVEIFSIIIAFSIFIIAWNARRIIDNDYYLFIGIALLFIGIIDLVHTLSYKGVGIIPDVGTNHATQLWIAARYMFSISFLAALSFIHRKIRPLAIFTAYTVITGLLFTSIFYWQNFPAAFIEDTGLTPFKVISEYIISLILALDIILLYHYRRDFNPTVLRYLVASLALTIASEMAFTLYQDPYGFANMIGHLLKVIAFFLIYQAFITIGVTRPDELLFRNLKQSEEKLTAANQRLTQEIKEREKAEADLRRQEERFHHTLDFMLEGCQIISFDYRYLYINDAAAHQGQKTRYQLIGHTMMESYPGIEQTTMFKHLQNCMEHRTPYRMDNMFSYPDGSSRWFELSIQPVPEGLFILSQDVTKRKTLDKEMRQMNKKLLQQSQELADANKELEAFSYSVSHDLRAPLRSISGFSQSLTEDYTQTLDDQGKDYLARIRNATLRMEKMIDDLLRLSRVTRTELHIETVDLTELSTAILHRFQESEPSRKTHINIQPRIIAKGDKNLLEIMMENLLGNAWKYSSKKEDTIIEVGILEKKNETVTFIRDNGAGFDMAYADKLFTPFQRLHSNSDFPGTGIGLAIVYRIVHRHKGKIWAESQVDKGTTVYFTLPETTDSLEK